MDDGQTASKPRALSPFTAAAEARLSSVCSVPLIPGIIRCTEIMDTGSGRDLFKKQVDRDLRIQDYESQFLKNVTKF